MNRSGGKRYPGRAFALAAWSAATVIWVGAYVTYAIGLRFNSTPSLPVGFWLIKPLRTPLSRGMIVSFCPPQTIQRRRAPGTSHIAGDACPNGETPFLKPVIAVPGDVVLLSNAGMVINGHPISDTRRLPLNSSASLPPGEYHVPNGQFWAVSNLHSRSFDSRYFGPINIQCIQGLGTALLVSR